jgi:hypothetical protein
MNIDTSSTTAMNVHMKADGLLDKSWLKGALCDAMHAVLRGLEAQREGDPGVRAGALLRLHRPTRCGAVAHHTVTARINGHLQQRAGRIERPSSVSQLALNTNSS